MTEPWVLEALRNTKPSFMVKVLRILTDVDIKNRLMNELPEGDDITVKIYRNKFRQFCDGLILGLGHFNENKITEENLYSDLEPFIDRILSHQ